MTQFQASDAAQTAPTVNFDSTPQPPGTVRTTTSTTSTSSTNTAQ